jgi:hypothetical protein
MDEPLEARILARLADTLPAGTAVHASPALDDLLELDERPLQVSAAYVIYLGADPLGDGGPAAGLRRRDRVAVIAAWRDRSTLLSGAAAQTGARALETAIQDALHGWQPVARTRPLVWARTLQPVYSSGLCLLPVLFTHDSARHAGA